MDATEQRYRRTAVIEQPEDGPQDYLVTITGGNCRYPAVAYGGGFAWGAPVNECVANCAACLAVDSAEFIAAEHDAPTALGETLDVACTDCGGPRWNGKLELPDGDSLRTSSTRLIRNIQRGEATAPELGDKVWVRQYFGQWVIVGNAVADTGGGGGSSGGGCGCCDCLDCVRPCTGDWLFDSAADGAGGFTWVDASDTTEGDCRVRPTVNAAFLETHGTPTGLGETLTVAATGTVSTVSDCSACPNKALAKYGVALGTWAAWPNLGGNINLIRRDAGSCVWKSRLLVVRDPLSGCKGVYQYELTQAGVDSVLQLFHVSGEDPLDLASLTHHVKWTAVAPWSCLCPSKLQAVNGELFPTPSGLKCQVCLEPGGFEPALVACNTNHAMVSATLTPSSDINNVPRYCHFGSPPNNGLSFRNTDNICNGPGAYPDGNGVASLGTAVMTDDDLSLYGFAGGTIGTYEICHSLVSEDFFVTYPAPDSPPAFIKGRLFLLRANNTTNDITRIQATLRLDCISFACGSVTQIYRGDVTGTGGSTVLSKLALASGSAEWHGFPDTLTVEFNEPDDDTTEDVDCYYTSISDGAGGFTWEPDIANSCPDGCGSCPTVDAAFITAHGAPTALGQTLTVTCPS